MINPSKGVNKLPEKEKEMIKMTKRYYLTVSPRGFANETEVYSFASKAARDAASTVVNNNTSAWAADLTGAALRAEKRHNAREIEAWGKIAQTIKDGDNLKFALDIYGDLRIGER